MDDISESRVVLAAAPGGAGLPSPALPDGVASPAAAPAAAAEGAAVPGIASPGAAASGAAISWGTIEAVSTGAVSLPLSADSAGLIDQLRILEDAKSAFSAMQARISVAFDAAQRRTEATAGVPPAERGKGVAEQIALARRESPNRGGRLLGLAKALVTEMPHTLAALETGQLNEWRATLLVQETACLSAEDRCAIDEDLAADTGTLAGMGDRALVAAAKAAAYGRDPHSVMKRASHAVTERTVSLRPAPDTMTYLTALLPVAQGVAAYAALSRQADTARSDGDQRTRGQLMADALVERTTGTPAGISGVEIQLVMTDRTLFQGDSEPARLAGYGIVPSGWARSLISAGDGGEAAGAEKTAPSQDLKAWVRRLYTAPGTGDLVAMDSRARFFPPRLRRFIQARDDTCRTPYCDAPHPAPRPHQPLARQRNHHRGQRRWTVRSLQPHQRTPRLESHPTTRTTEHHRTPRPHRPHLPLHRAPTPRKRQSRVAETCPVPKDGSESSAPRHPTSIKGRRSCSTGHGMPG